MNAGTVPAPGTYTVTPPSRGALVHYHHVGDYVNATDTPEYGVRSTSCGRKVPASWTVQAMDPATAVQQVTCPNCAAWARYHHAAELQGHRDSVATVLAATDAANSPEAYARLLAAHTPAEAPGQAPSCTSASYGDRGRLAMLRNVQQQGRARMAAATPPVPASGTPSLC